MHWRERARLRRANVELPAPPLQVFLPLTQQEQAQLAKLGRPSEVVGAITKRFLSRQARANKGKA